MMIKTLTSQIKKLTKTHLQRSALIVVAIVLATLELSVVIQMNTSNYASADTNVSTKSAGVHHEAIFAFIEICTGFGKGGSQGALLLGEIKDEDVAEGKFFYNGGKKTKVSKVWDTITEGTCEGFAKNATKELYEDGPTGFVRAFYTLSEGVWKPKDEYNSEAGGKLVLTTLRRLAQDKHYYDTLEGGPSGLFARDTLSYRYNALRPAFTSCFKRNDDETDDKTYFTIGPDNLKYSYKGGKDDKVNVGPIMDRIAAAGGGFANDGDGEWSCHEFRENIIANRNYFRQIYKSTDQLNEEAAEKTRLDKITAVTEKFAEKPTRLNDCIQLLGTDDGRSGSSEFVYPGVATWLVDHDSGEAPAITVEAYGETYTIVSEENADDFRTCLLAEDGYGTELTDILDVEPPVRTDTGSSSTPPEDSCESGGGTMSWLVCPIIDLVSNTFNWVDEQIQALLAVDREKYTSDEMYSVWKNFRNIGYAVLVILMLVMVISTAIGSQMFDAYTVKKAIPRMVAAVIFMTLSWYAMVALIDLSNVVGNGVLGIMTSPFSSIRDGTSFASLFSGATAGAASAVGVGGVLGITGAMFLVPGALGIILSWVGSALLVIGLAFLVLVLRQMFIIVLMLMAPVAILAWIFPGNDKLWKLWWGSFSKLLMMFPLIMALLASGRIFSFVIATSPGGGGVQSILDFIIKISAYVLPFAFIPFTFKFAGGMFSSIAGMAGDRSKGFGDRLKKRRQNRFGEMGQRAKSGELFKGRQIGNRLYGGGATEGLNRRTAGLATGYKGRFGYGEQGVAAVDAALMTAADAKTKSEQFQAMKDHDYVLQAAASGLTREEAVRNMMTNFGHTQESAEAYVRQAEATIGLGRASQVAAAKQLVVTGTGYNGHEIRDANGALTGEHMTGMEEMARTLAVASGGSTNTASQLAGFANATTKQVGRHDLAPSFGTLNKLVHQVGGIDQRETDDATGQTVVTQNHGLSAGETEVAVSAATEAAWGSAGLYQLANDKATTMKQFADHWVQEYDEGMASGDLARVEAATVAMKEMKAMLPNASGDNQVVINDALEALETMQSNAHASVSADPAGQAADGRSLGVVAEEYGQAQATLRDSRSIGPERAQAQAVVDAHNSRRQAYHAARAAGGPPTKEAQDAHAIDLLILDQTAERKARTYERFDPNREQA